MEIFTDANYWYWLILGIVLLIIELFAWSTLFLWMGLSAIVVGILFYLFPVLSWEWQFLLFVFLSMVSIYIGKRLFEVVDIDNDLNNRALSHIGKIYIVVEVGNNGNKIQVGDSLWLAQGCEMKVGQKVKVVGVKSATLIVESV